jgi:hypothetical protein
MIFDPFDKGIVAQRFSGRIKMIAFLAALAR